MSNASQNEPKNQKHNNCRIIRIGEVKSRTSLARSTIYKRINDGDFPKPIKIGVRAVGWLEEDIDDWLDRKILESLR